MPTLNRDQINAGAVITDPAFRDAEEAAAANGGATEGTATAAETAPTAESGVADGDGAAGAMADEADGAEATAEVPRMDDLEESEVTGFQNRLDERMERGFELPDAARQHVAAAGPGGEERGRGGSDEGGSDGGPGQGRAGQARADDPDEKPFEAPRSWSDAGAEHASGAASGASGASGASDASGASRASSPGDGGDERREGAGGGADWRQTNGTPHPSEDSRPGDGSAFETDQEPGGYEHAPDFDSSTGGASEGRGRGGGAGRDAEEMEPEE